MKVRPGPYDSQKCECLPCLDGERSSPCQWVTICANFTRLTFVVIGLCIETSEALETARIRVLVIGVYNRISGGVWTELRAMGGEKWPWWRPLLTS